MSRTKFLEYGKMFFGLLIFFFILTKAKENWFQIQPILKDIDIKLVGMAILAQIGAFAFLPVPSFLALRNWGTKTGKSLSFFSATRIFFLSQIAKYLPGSIWIFPARIYLVNQLGFTVSAASFMLFYETLTLLCSSLFASWVALPFFPVQLQSLTLPLFILVVLGFIVIVAMQISPNLIFSILPADWRPPTTKPRSFLSSLPTATYALGSLLLTWLLSGLSFYMILASIHAPVSPSQLLSIIGAFALSWLLGFLVIISPGGVGVREAAIIYLLGGIIAGPLVAIAAVISRLLWTLCELMLYFLFSFMPMLKPKA